ncbi:MAG: PadR family transcriptional regulator [Ilumatobacteraceae bacterium]
MNRSDPHDLLLGEWACLGILCQGPAHGFAVAAQLKPGSDIGRVWSMSRALTYRSLEQLKTRGHIAEAGEEPGIAGGNRRILAPTREGRSAFRQWVHTPVDHLRDLRSELLLKILLGRANGVNLSSTINAQLARVTEFIDSLERTIDPMDAVDRWRMESAEAARRFLESCRNLSAASRS